MIGRRGVFGVLLGAPAVAKAAMQETSRIGMHPPDYGGPEEAFDVEVEVEESALERAYRKARDQASLQREAKTCLHSQMPAHIAEKKSWSTSFKQKVWEDERREYEELWGWGQKSEAEMLRALASIGKRFLK